MKFNPRRTRNIAAVVCGVCFAGAGVFAAMNPLHDPVLKTRITQVKEELFAAKANKTFALSRLETANKKLAVCLDKRDENNKPMKCNWDVSIVNKAETAKKAVEAKEKELKQAEDAHHANIAKTATWIVSLFCSGLIAYTLASMTCFVHKLISISKSEDKQKPVGVQS